MLLKDAILLYHDWKQCQFFQPCTILIKSQSKRPLSGYMRYKTKIHIFIFKMSLEQDANGPSGDMI